MKVKIIKASEDTFWYAKHIGQIFEVDKLWKGEYRLLPYDPNGDFYIVAEDCEVQ